MTRTLKKTIPRFETHAFSGVVVYKDGIKDIKWHHPSFRQREVDKFGVNDTILEKLTNRKRIRTSEQNRYMHLYFSLVALAHGHGVTTEDVKNWAKGKCLSQGITEVFGEKTRKVKGTSELTVLETIEFLARVECESGISLPDTSPFELLLTHEEFREIRDKERIRYLAMKPQVAIG